MPGRALRRLLPAWTVSHAIKLPPELLSPPGAGRKDSEGAGARCCLWPGGTLGALLLAEAVPGAGPTEKAVPGAAALPRGGKGVLCPDTPPPPGFNSMLWRAGEELFSMFLCFPLCLFFFFSLFLFNWLNTSRAPSHATIPSATLEGNEAFAAKSNPCLFPQPLKTGARLVCPAQGLAFLVQREPEPGSARAQLPAPFPTLLPPLPHLAACLSFQTGPGVGCPGVGCPAPLPARLRRGCSVNKPRTQWVQRSPFLGGGLNFGGGGEAGCPSGV